MRARYIFCSACLVSCLAVACGDDDSSGSPGKGGTTGKGGTAGAPVGDAGAGSSSGGTGATGGTTSGGKTGMAGASTEEPLGGAGGMASETPDGFSAFVHDLVENQTLDTNSPTKPPSFADPTDEHGHYLVPSTDFDDLF